MAGKRKQTCPPGTPMAKSKAKRSRARKGVQMDPGQKRGPVKHPTGRGVKSGGYGILEWRPTRRQVAPNHPSGKGANTTFDLAVRPASTPTGQALHKKYTGDAIDHVYHLHGWAGGKRWDAANPGKRSRLGGGTAGGTIKRRNPPDPRTII